jgi:hypothetical protein
MHGQLSLPRIGIAVVMALAAIVGLAFGWWRNDEVRDHVPAVAAEPAWNVPKPAVTDLSRYATILAQRQPFGAPAPSATSGPGGAGAAGAPNAPSPGAAAAVKWQVNGIVTTDASRYLVVMIQNPGEKTGRPELRRVGDALPDGSTVRAIEPGEVTLDRDGTEVIIKMFVRQ